MQKCQLFEVTNKKQRVMLNTNECANRDGMDVQEMGNEIDHTLAFTLYYSIDGNRNMYVQTERGNKNVIICTNGKGK